MPVTSKPADNAAGRWLALLLVAATLLGGCATHRLQPDTGKQPDYALPPAAAGPLHELAERAARGADEDESSFLALSSNVEALKWRMLLLFWHRGEIPNNAAIVTMGVPVQSWAVHLPVLFDLSARLQYHYDIQD